MNLCIGSCSLWSECVEGTVGRPVHPSYCPYTYTHALHREHSPTELSPPHQKWYLFIGRRMFFLYLESYRPVYIVLMSFSTNACTSHYLLIFSYLPSKVNVGYSLRKTGVFFFFATHIFIFSFMASYASLSVL